MHCGIVNMEAEYVALTDCVKEVIWYRALLMQIGQHALVGGPTIIYCDSQSAKVFANDKITKGRSKHIDIRHHISRDAVEKELVKLVYVSTHDNQADLLTKGLHGPRLLLLLRAWSMVAAGNEPTSGVEKGIVGDGQDDSGDAGCLVAATGITSHRCDTKAL